MEDSSPRGLQTVLAFRPAKRGVVALVLALAGFVVYFGESGRTIRNGRVVDSYNYNYAAVVLGAAAVAMAGYEVLQQARGEQRDRSKRILQIGFLAAVGLLGAYQILRGLDLA